MITLLATGGTIASVDSPHGRIVGATGHDLLEQAKRVWPLPDVTVRETRSLVSSALSGDDIHELVRHCQIGSPVVVTHGTDAMEETAIALALFRAPDDPPVVLTGAQRPFNDPSPDGPRNLAAAIRWATSQAARNTGVSVVFGDAVLPAVGVRKTHTLALTGFSAPGRGPFAVVDESGVRMFARPVLPDPLLSHTPPRLANIHVLPSYVGAGPEALEGALSQEGVAVVVEGMGAGNAPPQVTSRLVAAIGDGVPVVITSRTGAGATVGLYAGGGADLARAGAVFAGDLSTAQARWVLAASLEYGADWKSRLTRWLRQAGCLGE